MSTFRSNLRCFEAWLSGTSFGFQLIMVFAVTVAVFLYYLMAFYTFDGLAKLIAGGNFYVHSDFGIANWQAGVSLRHGDVAGVYQRQWLYPPPMAPLVAFLSLFPLTFSFWLWRVGSFLISALLLRRAGLPWWVIVIGLCGPAEFYDIVLGQNGTFTSGVFVSALLLMEATPRFGGGLAGMLCIKPQIALLFPFILLRPEYRKALVFCVVVVLLLCGLGTLIGGWKSWALFIYVAQPIAHAQLARPFGEAFQLADFTVFMALRSLGIGLNTAWAVQGLCAVAAAILTWRIWGLNNADPLARMVITVNLWMLAVPFGFTYDLICFSIAVAALATRVPHRYWPVLILLWLWPGLSKFITAESHIVLMPIAAVICLCIAWPVLSMPSWQSQP